MKKLLIATLSATLILILIQFPKPAIADEIKYSRILTSSTAFYSDSAGKNFKFYLPYTYYVKIISVGETFTKVSYGYEDTPYPFLNGYVRNVDLNPCDETPVSPYAKTTLCTVSDGVLFSDKELTKPKTAVYSGNIVYYYGLASTDETAIYYVYYDGNFGYMKKDVFPDFELANHPTPLPTVPEPTEEIKEDLPTPVKNAGCQKADNIQTVVIAGISVVAVSLVYLLFKPSGQRENLKEDE